MSTFSPLVIGGVPKSGTRVYQRLAEVAGYEMCTWPIFDRGDPSKRVRSGDCRPLARRFYPKWIDPYLRNELSLFGRIHMKLACEFQLRTCIPRRDHLWGWKNPRSLFLINFFADMYSDMFYIHVIRDPRDLAFHPTHPLNHHQDCFLTADQINQPEHVRRAHYWNRLNELGEKDGENFLPGQYLQTKLEDLCADPRREIARIYEFLNISDDRLFKKAADLIDPPDSIGRWREQPIEEVQEIEKAACEGMLRYGYRFSDEGC